MIFDWFFDTLVYPLLNWLAAVFDSVPDIGAVSWVVQGWGTLDRVAPLSLVVGLVTPWLAALGVMLLVRGGRMVFSAVTLGGANS